jgi:hypothetical protein
MAYICNERQLLRWLWLFHDARSAGAGMVPSQSERPMTAAISTPIVQPAFGLRNLMSAQWLVVGGLSGQTTTEDIEMFARKALFSSIGRTAVLATVAAVALTAVEPSLAVAGSAPSGVSANTASSGATDFSSRGRRYGGGAAAAAAFAGIVGTGLAIAASQPRYGYYDDSYAYYGGGYPGYYGGGPVYYGRGDCVRGNPCYGGQYPYGAYGRRFPVP